MKIRNLIIVLTLIIIGFACEKEEDNSTSLKQEESTLKFSNEELNASQTNAVPFEILGAGVYGEVLYMTVSYTGGEFGHEFMANWDGNVINDGDKKVIDLNIFHLTDDDNGTNQIYDSVFVSISELNIPGELLQDEALWYDVINAANTANHILFQANPTIITGGGDTNPTEDVEMIVISSSCDMQGVWNELWLKNAENGSDLYYFPLEIDQSITYTPAENDKLKIDFEYTYFTDSTVVLDCDFWFEHRVIEIKITDLEVID